MYRRYIGFKKVVQTMVQMYKNKTKQTSSKQNKNFINAYK